MKTKLKIELRELREFGELRESRELGENRDRL